MQIPENIRPDLTGQISWLQFHLKIESEEVCGFVTGVE